MIAFLSANHAVAQEDLQVLQPSSPSTTEPGMSINNSLASNTTRTTMDSSGSIQNRVTVGSFGDDRITGSNETDIMIGLLGADTIRGDGGDDKIQGNEDLDKLYGEEGNDLLQGGAATDQLYGGDGDDILSGGLGDDFAHVSRIRSRRDVGRSRRRRVDASSEWECDRVIEKKRLAVPR